MTTDAPDEQDPGGGTPDDATQDSSRNADGPRSDRVNPTRPFASELPEAEPLVSLIDDTDLSWVDKPQKSDEEIAAREARKEAHKQKVRRKRRLKKAAKISGVVLAFFLVLGLVWFQYTFGGLERMPASHGQAGLDTPGTTMLLVGANPSEPDAANVTGSDWRHDLLTSDLVMLLHLTRDNRSMYVISIPADSLLPIPGSGEGKLAQAYERGGEKLYVRTIEEYTGVRLDRVATLDMNALREITDQLEGVILDVPREACGVPAGPRRLDGAQALDYMALQSCLPRKDLDRVERQQSVLRGLMRSAVDGGKVTNPFTVQKMLRVTASNLTLEDGFGYPSMFLQLFSMRHLRSTNTTFLTMPTAEDPLAVVDGQAVVRLDPAKDASLWDALRKDRLGDYLATNTDAVVLQ